MKKKTLIVLRLPSDWHYYSNEHGEGKAIDFLLEAKLVVSWTPSRYHFANGKLETAPRMPLERVSLGFVRRACDLTNL